METFDALNTVIWSISPDTVKRLTAFRGFQKVKIPLLIDADSEVIRSYGILNEKQGSVPHPAVVLVDKEGEVTFFHLDEDYTKRPPVATLIEAARKIEDTAKEP